MVRPHHNRRCFVRSQTAGATASTTEWNSRASGESGLLCSHSHGEYTHLIALVQQLAL